MKDRINGIDGWNAIAVDIAPDQTSYIDTEVNGGATYYYRVMAKCDGCLSLPSNVANCLAPLAAPSMPVVHSMSNSALEISWWGVDGASDYAIYRSVSAGGTYQQIASNITSYSYPDASLSASTQYYYKIAARSSAGYSGQSGAGNGWTRQNALSGVTAMYAADKQIAIAWTDALGETGYAVERAVHGMDSWTTLTTSVAANAVGYIDSSVEYGLEYDYRVQAVNPGGTSGHSNIAMGWTAPPRPGALRAIALSSGIVELSWLDTLGETAYIVNRSPNGNDSWTTLSANVPADATRYEDQSAAPGECYYYHVHAFNSAGISVASNCANTTTPAATIIALAVAPVSESENALTWSDTNDETGYLIMRSLSGTDGWTTVTTTTLSMPNVVLYNDSKVSRGSRFYYQVFSLISGQITCASNIAYVDSVPDIPSVVSIASLTTSSIGVEWLPISGAASYKVVRSATINGVYGDECTTSGIKWISTSGLNPESRYYYKVSAINSSGTSGYCAPVPCWTRPCAPAGLQLASKTRNTVNLQWADALTSGSMYVIERSTDGVNYQLASTSTLSSFADSSLAPAKDYFYRIGKSNAGGRSKYSNVLLVTTDSIPVSEAFASFGNCTWVDGGAEHWFGPADIFHSSTVAIRSGRIGHNQTSEISTGITGPGTFTFWWSVSSEQYFDTLSFWDGTRKIHEISGEAAWEQKSYEVPSGAHAIRFVYSKDATVSGGLDRGVLDYLCFVAAPSPSPSPSSSPTPTATATQTAVPTGTPTPRSQCHADAYSTAASHGCQWSASCEHRSHWESMAECPACSRVRWTDIVTRELVDRERKYPVRHSREDNTDGR